MDVRLARLKRYGDRLKRISTAKWIDFTGQREMDLLLNDLERHAHFFLMGILADRQVKSWRAWTIPVYVSKKIGSTEFEPMRRIRKSQWMRILKGPPSLHRFPEKIGEVLYESLRLVQEKYDSNASAIWAGRPPSAELVSRFLEFHGVGPKLATLAVNLLSTRYSIPLADHYSVDISADIHVRRVFKRLEFVEPNASVEQVIYRARALNPTFPGALDRPAYEIGRKWCRPNRPLCLDCVMREVCPSAKLK